MSHDAHVGSCCAWLTTDPRRTTGRHVELQVLAVEISGPDSWIAHGPEQYRTDTSVEAGWNVDGQRVQSEADELMRAQGWTRTAPWSEVPGVGYAASVDALHPNGARPATDGRSIVPGDMDFEHCSGCGQAYAYEQAHDSYTGCCNEGVCGGPRGDGTRNWNLAASHEGESRWVTVRVIPACCGAGAEALAKELGLVVTSMNTDRR